MSLVAWVSITLLFGAIDSCDVYIKTNQWPGRSVIVQMFEWKWLDIADECEMFLGPKGYGGVQTSPASENLVIHLPDNTRPWYERYQVVSYQMTTRSGTEEDFLNMTTRCNRVGVRIYVDVVFNHMTGQETPNRGTAGNTGDSWNNSYPAVPYTDEHFHHPRCAMKNLDNATEVRVCELVGLKDLNQTMPYVRQKIIQYLNKLIKLGVAGFRVDAAKHMWPADLKEIYKYLDNLNTKHGFRPNSRPYIYQEVSLGGVVTPSDYMDLGDVTEFNVVYALARAFSGTDNLNVLATWGNASDMVPSNNALVFVDNHDIQRAQNILNYKNGTLYQAAIAFLLAHTYGQPRIVSGYEFESFAKGPPSDDQERIIGATINADESCGGGWVCEHRFPAIYRIVGFRNEVHKTEVTNWWSNGKNQIAFSRGNKGFIVFNTEGTALNMEVQTGLPAGTYCDIISGKKDGNTCTGTNVTVCADGFTHINLSGIEEIYLAIHVGKESSLQTS